MTDCRDQLPKRALPCGRIGAFLLPLVASVAAGCHIHQCVSGFIPRSVIAAASPVQGRYGTDRPTMDGLYRASKRGSLTVQALELGAQCGRGVDGLRCGWNYRHAVGLTGLGLEFRR
jgi:hypothetical protein